MLWKKVSEEATFGKWFSPSILGSRDETRLTQKVLLSTALKFEYLGKRVSCATRMWLVLILTPLHLDLNLQSFYIPYSVLWYEAQDASGLPVSSV